MADLSSLGQPTPSLTDFATLGPSPTLGNLPVNLDTTPVGKLLNFAKTVGSPLPGTGGAQGLVTAGDVLPQLPRSKKDLAWMALTTLAPSVLAMIPTAKNLPRFMAQLSDNIKGLPKTPENLAEAFMKTRYPRRMSLASTFYDPEIFNEGALGEATPVYEPGAGPNDKPWTTEVRYSADPRRADPVQGMVNTLGHETQHAVQYNRIPSWAMDLDRYLPYVDQFAEFGNASKTGTSLLPGGQPQPRSTGAWGAGTTAENAYLKLMKLLSAAKRSK